jgi:hypothetical protein
MPKCRPRSFSNATSLDGHTIDEHLAISGIVHPSDQFGNGAFAAAGMARDGQGAARPGTWNETHVPQRI